MPKRRCGRCRYYFDRDTMVKRGLSSFCEKCVGLPVERPTKIRKPIKVHGPTHTEEKFRKAVASRDLFRCRYCGVTGGHAHHISYRSQGGHHDPSNGIFLCPVHHELVHSNKKLWQPILRFVVWQTYYGRRYTVPEAQRYLEKQEWL